jgi:GGDEF domain-containing protein
MRRRDGRYLTAVPGGPDRDTVLALSLIAQDLSAKPRVATALVAAAGTNGVAEVLATASPDAAPLQRTHDFVSRAVRAERPMAEPLDPAQDRSLGGSAVAGSPTYAISAPLVVPGLGPGALCAGVSAPEGEPDANLVWVLHAYARMASSMLGERQRHAAALAARDDVTRCLTYAAVLHRLDAELDRCRRLDLELACCFVGLQAGAHRYSDRDLAAAGRAIRTVVSEGDGVGRYGHEQFIVVLPGTDRDAGLLVAELIIAALRRELDGLDGRVGVAQWIPGTGADRLLGDADQALSAAKRWPARRVAATG